VREKRRRGILPLFGCVHSKDHRTLHHLVVKQGHIEILDAPRRFGKVVRHQELSQQQANVAFEVGDGAPIARPPHALYAHDAVVAAEHGLGLVYDVSADFGDEVIGKERWGHDLIDHRPCKELTDESRCIGDVDLEIVHHLEDAHEALLDLPRGENTSAVERRDQLRCALAPPHRLVHGHRDAPLDDLIVKHRRVDLIQAPACV
jgi:hypothetical protein